MVSSGRRRFYCGAWKPRALICSGPQSASSGPVLINLSSGTLAAGVILVSSQPRGIRDLVDRPTCDMREVPSETSHPAGWEFSTCTDDRLIHDVADVLTTSPATQVPRPRPRRALLPTASPQTDRTPLPAQPTRPSSTRGDGPVHKFSTSFLRSSPHTTS